MRERPASCDLTGRTDVLLPFAELTEAGEQQAQALNDLLKEDDTFAQITGNHSVRLVVSPLSRCAGPSKHVLHIAQSWLLRLEIPHYVACRQALQQGAADRQKRGALLCSGHMLSVEPSACSRMTALVQHATRLAMHMASGGCIRLAGVGVSMQPHLQWLTCSLSHPVSHD